MAKIGIDFGTTNSLIVAYNRENNSFDYFNYDEDTLNPIPTSSTVWYYDDIVIVGSEARENINTYSGVGGHHFEKSIKLSLGSGLGKNIFENSVPPYKIAADILNHLKIRAIEDWSAESTGVRLNQAVFTIPINFTGKQREDLRKAAHEAGIEITTFIHEPFASIVGYYFSRENGKTTEEVLNSLEELNAQYLLTFDWGGGTLDITVVKVESGKMIEIGNAELTGKAGDKFDEDIAKWAWSKFLNKHGFKYNEAILEQIRKDKWDRILVKAEQCKIQLSSNSEASLLVTDVIDGIDISEEITRSDFEKLIDNTLLEAVNEIDKAIRVAGIGDNDIEKVFLIGGTCYIPAVQNRLQQKFGHRVNVVQDAELLIAQGAAVIAEMGWLPFLTKDISIQLSDDSLYPIFEKDTNIAADSEAKKTEELICADNRGGSAKIIIVEGQGQKKDRNLTILKVPVLNHANFNDDIKLDAIIDRNIVLKLSARSFMVKGYGGKENYSITTEAEVHQLCFGLDFNN